MRFLRKALEKYSYGELMIRNRAVLGLAAVILSIAGLYAQEQIPTLKPVLTEKAMKGFIKNPRELIDGIEAFEDDEDSQEGQWVERFKTVIREDAGRVSDFLEKNPAPKKMQAFFRKYGFDGKTGILQTVVLVIAVVNSEREDVSDVPFRIHPDDIKLVEKYKAELLQLLRSAFHQMERTGE